MDISNLLRFEHMEITRNRIVVQTKYRDVWCILPYPGHPKGCPNFGKTHCPPYSPFFREISKGFSIFTLVWCRFDFNEYKLQMEENHRDWSPNRRKCVIYWQNQLKSELKAECERLMEFYLQPQLLGCGSGFAFNSPSMESTGINVFSTLKRNRISFEIKPQNTITMVCLIMSKGRIQQKVLDSFCSPPYFK